MKKYFFLFAFLLLVLNWNCRPDLKIPKPSGGEANFSKFVAIGGNFMAGYQDWSLNKSGQKYSVPYQLAKFMHLAGGAAAFAQPFMPDDYGLGLNSKTWENTYFKAGYLNYATDCKGVKGLMPIVNSFATSAGGVYLQHTGDYSFQNFGVPYAKISDYNNASLGISGNANPYYARFATNPGVSTMLSDAKAQSPTFFALWAGMEDIYDYAANGGYKKTILSSSTFEIYLDSILLQLNTKGAIANIPDLSCFPFYTTVPWNGLDLTRNLKDSLNMLYFGDSLYAGSTSFQIGKNGFMIEDPNSVAPPAGYRKTVSGDYILLTVPLDSMKCNFLGAFTPLPNRYVLDTTEVNIINQAVRDYNAVIAAKAQQYKLALVDMNSYFKKVQSGIKWDGVDFNAQFVSGGFFSLDGYCPNQKGYALVANEFIRSINATYSSTIPWVNCPECNGIKFP